jgi:hypothetical protein
MAGHRAQRWLYFSSVVAETALLSVFVITNCMKKSHFGDAFNPLKPKEREMRKWGE